MKARIWLLVTIIAIALVAILLIWRFCPLSFSNTVSIGENSISGFSAIATVSRIENGEPKTDTYRIDGTAQQITPQKIIEILSASSYRQDFRNLLPLQKSLQRKFFPYLSFRKTNMRDLFCHLKFGLPKSLLCVPDL